MHLPTAFAFYTGRDFIAPISCSAPANPTSNSLLVILLDRSGSLNVGPSPNTTGTDPDGYSTSITKALTDLWPGSMVFIPFSGDSSQVPVFGPVNLSDSQQRTTLKEFIQHSQIGGDTPLDPAMREALNLLRKAPAGSRVILITDGSPTGIGTNDEEHQEQDIRTTLIPKFCQQGIPVNVFGLKIDLTTSDGQNAGRLLTQISVGTGAGPTYIPVQSAEELATSVINHYADWLGLSFTQIKRDPDGSFPVSIDSFAQEVYIATFRSNNNSRVTLTDPNENVVQNVQTSTPPDRHYKIYYLHLPPPVTAGIYTVNIDNDPHAEVYALVHSSLNIKILTPTTSSPAGKPIHIQAAFFDGETQLQPEANRARVRAYVSVLIKGKFTPSGEVDLTQQPGLSLFDGQAKPYDQSGIVQIVIMGTYMNAQRSTEVIITILPSAPMQCTTWNIPCLSIKYPWVPGFVATCLIVAGLIIGLLFSFLKKKLTKNRAGA